MRILTAAAIVLASVSTCQAGDLVRGGTIVSVTNTASNTPTFGIQVAGGSVNLCPNTWIFFPVSAAANEDVHKRAYANALLALATGAKVRVHNYQGTACDTAAFLEIAAP